MNKKETDPNGIEQHAAGAKLDDGKLKAGVLKDFSLALAAVAEVGTFGANKYTRGGWQSVPNGIERYDDAFWRHLLEERHEPVDAESGMPHEWHLAWNLLATIELTLRQKRDNTVEIKEIPTSAYISGQGINPAIKTTEMTTIAPGIRIDSKEKSND